MTAPERRRPLPALAFIAALCLLTALVWFRVLHRRDGSDAAASRCPSAKPGTSTTAAPQNSNVLPTPGEIAVLVLNSTQRNGIATATKKILEGDGFKVTQAADDVKAYGGHGLIKGVAEIRYGRGARADAQLLRYYFPNAAMKVTHSSSAVVTVSLGAKFTKTRTSAAVRKAVAKAHLKIGRKPTASPSAGASSGC